MKLPNKSAQLGFIGILIAIAVLFIGARACQAADTETFASAGFGWTDKQNVFCGAENRTNALGMFEVGGRYRADAERILGANVITSTEIKYFHISCAQDRGPEEQIDGIYWGIELAFPF